MADGKKITFRGVTYATQTDLYRAFNVTPASIYKIRKDMGLSLWDALEHYLYYRENKKPYMTLYGQSYSTLSEWCREVNIPAHMVYRMRREHNLTVEEAALRCLDIRKEQEVIHRGVSYPSLRDAAKSLGVHYGYLTTLIKDKSLTPSEAIDFIINNKATDVIYYNGEVFEDAEEACVKAGVLYSIFKAHQASRGLSNQEVFDFLEASKYKRKRYT